MFRPISVTWFLMLACLFSVIPVANSSPKNLNAVLSATWNSTSILLEVGEFLSHHSDQLYWQYIEAVSEGFIIWKGGQLTNQDEYTLGIQIAESLVSSSIAAVLEFSLAIHHYSPQLQLYRTVHADFIAGLDEKNDWANCPVLLAYGPSKAICGLDQFDFTNLEPSFLEIFDFDKVHPSSSASGTSVPSLILYGDITQAEKFLGVHRQLIEHSKARRIRYIFRPKVPDSTTSVLLQGFGVELAIKNMEYKVLDDSKIEIDESELGTGENLMFSDDDEESDVNGFYFKRLAERHPDLENELTKFKDSLLASSQEDAKVNVWDMNNLGLAAAQKIMRSPKPFELLREISQNFPSYASSLARVRLDSKVRKLLTKREITPGENSLSINSIKVNIEHEINLFTLQSLLQTEAATIDNMQDLNLPIKDIKFLMGLPIEIKEDTRTNMGFGTDAGDAITYLNDLSQDAKYESWSSSIRELLAPGWPGTLKYVRKNLYTGIVIFDPATEVGLEKFSQGKFFVKQNAPYRLGIVFFVPQSPTLSSTIKKEILDKCTSEDKDFLLQNDKSDDELGEQTADDSLSGSIAKLFNYLVEEHESPTIAFKFLDRLANKKKDMTTMIVKTAFLKISNSKDAFDRVINSEDGKEFVKKNQEYLSRRGFQQLLAKDPHPLLVVNGLIAPGQKGSFRNQLMQGIMKDQQHLMLKVHKEEIDEQTNMDSYFQKLPNSMPRIAPHILQSLKDFKLVSSFPSCQFIAHPNEEFTPKGASYMMAIDFSTLTGLKLAFASIHHIQIQPKQKLKSRVAFLPNPANDVSPIARFISGVLTNVVSAKKSFNLVRRAVMSAVFLWPKEQHIKKVLTQLILDAPLSTKVKDRVSKSLQTTDDSEKFRTANMLGFQPGDNMIVVNGRIISVPENPTINDLIYDLQLMDHFTDQILNSNKILDVLQNVQFQNMDPDDIDADWVDSVVMRASQSLLKRAINNPAKPSDMPKFQDGDTTIVGNFSSSLIKVTAMLDPLSQAAQWVTPVLIALRDGFGAEVRILLNPLTDLGKFPLKRFYRYAISPKLDFDVNSGEVKPVGALFKNLNTKSVLTLGMKTPESWLVASKQAHHDLDNIRFDELGVDTMSIMFELKYILISGQCYEKDSFDVPAGLQLDLSRGGQIKTDTTVMKNLGYFQLQGNPGVYSIILHGAEANAIYKMEKDDQNNDVKESSMQFHVNSFDAEVLHMNVVRKPGMAEVALGDEDQPDFATSIWGNLFGKGREKSSGAETLHVFSLASGHLYERFLKIMMLSVIKNTDSPIKFWFIENFASPQFKDFAPKMAKHYGYELEFVTYKWPMWLRRQTEKQRIIWGYKILFLDVLFPLNVSRIIYIDADQIVRGDIKELWDMDLKGAVYGYTPFCNSNQETEGFRFWKSGYWKNHLRGSPYHISALYVVDLVLFRQRKAGDTLRMIYDNLSQDPNSLSNLDQDLPNYAQHQVKIFSLPQEWLWCQTWCSMDTLKTAKTIDLCNNPLTKTPKLEVAKSLLPEWEVYDNEAKKLDSVFYKKIEKKTSGKLKEEL